MMLEITTVDMVVYPVIYKIFYIPGGVGFLPSAVSLYPERNLPPKDDHQHLFCFINLHILGVVDGRHDFFPDGKLVAVVRTPILNSNSLKSAAWFDKWRKMLQPVRQK